MTVVLDTNVLVAALVAEGLCREVVHRALRMRVVASSAPLLDELQSNLQRKFKVTPAVASFPDSLPQQVHLVEPQAFSEPVCRDADDDAVLATAIAAGAGLVVTGDRPAGARELCGHRHRIAPPVSGVARPDRWGVEPNA